MTCEECEMDEQEETRTNHEIAIFVVSEFQDIPDVIELDADLFLALQACSVPITRCFNRQL